MNIDEYPNFIFITICRHVDMTYHIELADSRNCYPPEVVMYSNVFSVNW